MHPPPRRRNVHFPRWRAPVTQPWENDMTKGHKEGPLRPFDEAFDEAVAKGGGILDTRLTLPSGVTKTLGKMTRDDLAALLEANETHREALQAQAYRLEQACALLRSAGYEETHEGSGEFAKGADDDDPGPTGGA